MLFDSISFSRHTSPYDNQVIAENNEPQICYCQLDCFIFVQNTLSPVSGAFQRENTHSGLMNIWFYLVRTEVMHRIASFFMCLSSHSTVQRIFPYERDWERYCIIEMGIVRYSVNFAVQ